MLNFESDLGFLRPQAIRTWRRISRADWTGSVSNGTTLGTICVIVRDRKEMYGACLERSLETGMYWIEHSPNLKPLES